MQDKLNNKGPDNDTSKQNKDVEEIMDSIMSSISSSDISPYDEVQEPDFPAADVYIEEKTDASDGSQNAEVDWEAQADEQASQKKRSSLDDEDEDTESVIRAYQQQQIEKQKQLQNTASFAIPKEFTGDIYRAEFDFGDTASSKILTVLPFVIHFLVAVALAGFYYYKQVLTQNQAVSLLYSDMFMNLIVGFAVIIGLGLLISLVVGIVAHLKSHDASWYGKSFLRGGITSLFGVILWIAAIIVVELLSQNMM